MSDWAHTTQQQHQQQQQQQDAPRSPSERDEELHGANLASSSSSAASSAATGPLSLLATPGPHPLPAYLKQIGAHVAALAAAENAGGSGKGASSTQSQSQQPTPVTPLLAAFVARALTLEAEEAAAARGEQSEYIIVSHQVGGGAGLGGGAGQQQQSQSINLSLELQDRLIRSTLHRLRQLDDPLLETIKMQVAFESLYATEIQRKRAENFRLDAANAAQLGRILEIGTNISSNAQVASLYRAIFKLMLANGCVQQQPAAGGSAGAAAPVPDRNVDREIAAALESVFPQAGLNAFNMLSPGDKKSQVLNLINIVLGIRLFNRDIKKGGAGLEDVPALAAQEVEALYDQFEKESTALGDICYTYSDVLNLELHAPGTISASVLRLQAELLNRRQYILLIHQLQHEVLESLDLITDARHKFSDLCSELRTLVGLRTSVPKEQVYPKFQQLAMYWRLLMEEREMNAMRRQIFHAMLLRYRQSFSSNLLEEDIELLRAARKDPAFLAREAQRTKADEAIDFDEFVETVQADGADTGSGAAAARGAGSEGEGGKSSSASSASYRPVRLIKDLTPNFMSLPLEYQGYCCWTIVHRGGLLLPGDPSLGIVRVLGRHYSFSSPRALRDFCEDPERYIEGVLAASRRSPALIHLLCLQPYILHSDISELFAIESMLAEGGGGGGAAGGAAANTKVSTGCQTPFHINTSVGDARYHWNEWDLRRAALQLADLMSKKTVSAQTSLSHFRRDNHTQYTLPAQMQDGTMEGKATQTGVEKSSQVERVYRFHAGLRGKPDNGLADPGAQMRVVELRVPSHVEDATNGNLQLKPHESHKTYIVRDQQM